MDKNKKQKILLAFLVVIAAVVWGHGIKSSSSMRGVKKGSEDIQTSLNEEASIFLSCIHSRKKGRSSYKDWGRNPFTLGAVENPKETILEGIIWDDANPQAVINGNIVSVGDKTASGTVVEIKPSSVILNNGTDQFELKLWHEG